MSDTTETVTYAYAAYKPCGCMVAAATDEPHNADDIAKWIRAGLRVERVTSDAPNAATPHAPPPARPASHPSFPGP
mgnify:CR=1 FL=1